MSATQTKTTTEGSEEAGLRGSPGTLIGEFSDEEGVRHQCRLARSKRAGEGLLYVSGPLGPPRCLGVIGGEGAELQSEAQALFADYRAASRLSRRCRAVSGEEARDLARGPRPPEKAPSPEPARAAAEQGRIHFDGPGIYAWMLAEGVISVGAITPEHGAAKARRINGWKRGGRASVQLVDELLTRHGRHIHEVPAELRRETTRACNRGARVSASARESAVCRFRAGERAEELADELAVSAHSIRNWARAAAAGAEAAT